MTNKEYREKVQGVASFDGCNMLNLDELKKLHADIRQRVQAGAVRMNDRATWRRVSAGLYVLTSYRTDVAAVRDGVLVRLWSGWSATTQKHVNQFCGLFRVAGVDKRSWHDMPVQRIV